ncbi:MAG: hypothetical protein LBT15_03945 [Synergistaceae bacterium]|nr:hypothetical protein [Synergistaceae bacterium]
MRAQRGSVLPMTILVMLVFTLLCVAMLSLSQMNMRYSVFFERRSILEQATLSWAQTMGDVLAENANAWWSVHSPDVTGKGALDVDSKTAPGIPGMRFTWTVTPHSGAYALFVQGRYITPGTKADDTVWAVSMDVYPGSRTRPARFAWSKHVRLN